jgi:two-component system nitrogen regulation sensor histidine kinase NtrY
MPDKSENTVAASLQRFTGWAGFLLVLLGTLVGVSIFAYLTGLTPFEPTPRLTYLFLIASSVIILLMAALIGWQVIFLLTERKRGTPGASLHIRLISLFSIIAIVPALLVAAFATVTLNRSLDTWFSDRTRSIVDGAVNVAEAYIRNSAEATRGDVASISADLNQQKAMYDTDRGAFVRRVARHAALRGLAGTFVFDQANKVIDVNVTANDNIQFRRPSPDAMEKADKGELVVIPPGPGGNVVQALIKLQSFPSHYLYVYRIINPSVIDQLAKTREAKNEYDEFLEQRVGVQLTFGLMYAVVAFVFLLAAIWTGLWFADRLVAPIVKLLDAARRVAAGDFGAKVAQVDGPGDLATLTQTFNLMTDQIKRQRDELVETNDQLDDRRRFIEAMLAGVSAGVAGIAENNTITLVNRSATNLLGRSEATLLNRDIAEALPEFASLFNLAVSRPSGFADGQVEFNGRTYFARITTERSDGAESGHVLTFDDITELVSAQRNSAWADIARRIAHEIKNPLTPIQLSAERLKRKYGREIQSDKQVFEQCTDTIIRQVGDIGRMVDEFSSFARMPKAVPEPQNLFEVVQDATVLQRVSSADIDIDIEAKAADFVFAFDRRLITQAVTNLVKNAREAIESRPQEHAGSRGRITVRAGMDDERPFVSVEDNGIGLPKENRHRLTEPYMTTREKGTGLGLAIVKRIMEEHGGRLKLEDAPSGQGALITLQFAALEEKIAVPA